jgi:hypothetical protein
MNVGLKPVKQARRGQEGGEANVDILACRPLSRSLECGAPRAAQGAATLTTVSGDHQVVVPSGFNKTAFLAPIVVKAQDTNGRPIT